MLHITYIKQNKSNQQNTQAFQNTNALKQHKLNQTNDQIIKHKLLSRLYITDTTSQKQNNLTKRNAKPNTVKSAQ